MSADHTEMQLMQFSNVNPATRSVTISRVDCAPGRDGKKGCFVDLVDQNGRNVQKEADCPWGCNVAIDGHQVALSKQPTVKFMCHDGACNISLAGQEGMCEVNRDTGERECMCGIDSLTGKRVCTHVGPITTDKNGNYNAAITILASGVKGLETLTHNLSWPAPRS